MASTLQQVMIGSLFIQSGGNLTLNSGVNRFVIASDVQVNGTLALVANAATEIVVGGSWTILGGTKSDQGFTPANSTVTYQGRGSASGKYYNVTFELNSDMSSSGNVTVDNYCTVNDTFYLRSTDTLVINDSASDALSNSGMIPRGTIRRSILFGDTNPYAYETEDTYIKFNSGSSYPHYFTITTYPDTNPNTFGGNWEVIPSTVDTIHNIVTATALSATGTFAIGTAEKGTPKVKRASASGGDTKSALNYQFAMRYAQSEVPTGVYESDLRLLHLVPAPAQYTLSLTALLEGEYNEPSMVADTVTVEMHGATSPYPLVERASVPLNSSGVGTAYFDSVTDGAHYYIVVKP
jgi:hypothetical protein